MKVRSSATLIDQTVGPRWWLSVPVFLLGVFLVAQRFPSMTDESRGDGGSPAPVRGAGLRTVSISGWIGPRVRPQSVPPVAPAPDPETRPRPSVVPPVAPGPAPAVAYTVRKGESLWGIAARFLGDGHRWTEIAAANPKLDPKRLRAGARLVIPGATEEETFVKPNELAGPSAENSPPPPKSKPRTHIVKAGETLSHLAVRYYRDRDWQRILRANRSQISGPKQLREGMRIVIPDESLLADAGAGGSQR